MLLYFFQKARGTGIAHLTVESVCTKMDDGEAVIAVTENGTWVGYCYIETRQDGKFVSNSGMIVSPAYRRKGVATAIKQVIFTLCHGITTGHAITKLNSRLGFEPVPYSEITTDKQFWSKCQHCINYDILHAKQCKNCLCTA